MRDGTMNRQAFLFHPLSLLFIRAYSSPQTLFNGKRLYVYVCMIRHSPLLSTTSNEQMSCETSCRYVKKWLKVTDVKEKSFSENVILYFLWMNIYVLKKKQNSPCFPWDQLAHQVQEDPTEIKIWQVKAAVSHK